MEKSVISNISNMKSEPSAETTILECLLTGVTKEEILAMCSTRLKVLIDSDKKRHTEYVKTLKAYIECNNDLLRASKVLYVHRNTIVQRIKKINSLLGTPVNEPATTNEFWNVFKILEFYGIKL